MYQAKKSFGKNSSNNNQTAMKKIITTTILTALASSNLFAQNVGIGTSTPSASSKLEISSTNSGLLIPRVALTALNAAGPITAPATSLLVYNTATAGVSPNNVTPGYYFWTGTVWSRLLNSASADWTLLGNAGTVAATNFIGTTDAVDFVTRTNNTERMRVYSGGGILVTSPNFNANAMSPAVDVQGAWLRLGDAAGNQTFTNGMGIKFHDSGVNHASMQYISSSNFINFGTSGGNGNALALDLAATPALAIDLSNRRIGIGTNAPAEAIHVIGNVRSSTLAGVGSRLVASDVNGTLTNIATGTNGQVLTLVAGVPAWATSASTAWNLIGNAGTNTATNFIGTTDNVDFATRTNNIERMRITSVGNVGIGTSTPAYRLDLATGTFAFGNSNVRTETRNDAGLQGNAGAQSGFFETSAPVNFPAGATSWWHLIDSRHSNNGNNYAMQIAGSFFDQDLWFRKTNGSATQAWTKILTTSNGWSTTGNTGTNASTNFIGTIDAVDFVTRTGNVERMRVMNNGNVGIGTAAPNSKLEVVGKIYSTGPAAECSAQDRTTGTQYTMYGTGGLMKLWRADYGDVINMTNTGFVGIGNVTPGVRLDVNGTIRAMDVYASGGQNLIIGDDTYFSDLDVANRLGLISTSNANIGELKLGNSATNPVLSGNPGYLYIDQEIRLQNNANVLKRATAPIIWTDQFDSGLGGVYSGNSESEEGGFWANGNYAMILSPGDNDLVKIVDEDYLDNTGSAYDNNAMRARIDGNGQYFQISDARSKTNIQPIQNSLEKLLAINGYTYEFTLLDSEKAKGQKAMLTTGVLAQELEKVLPEAVSNYEGNYMVNYAAMTPLLIEAIQEQQTMIDAQKQLIDEQMKLLQELKKEVETLKQK